MVTNNRIVVGTRCVTTRPLRSCALTMYTGTEVVVIGIGDRGYDLQDLLGNKVLETGWDSVKPIPSEEDLYDEAVRIMEQEVASVVDHLNDLAEKYQFERSWVRQKFRELLNQKLREE